MRIVLLLLCSALCFADNAARLAAIAGPVLSLGAGPWGFYENTEAPMAREFADAALGALPQYGTQLSGTFDLDTTACGITLTGAGASGATAGDYLLVDISTDSGTGTAPYVFIVGSVVGNVITSANQCGQILLGSQSGRNVYQCTAQCKDPVSSGGGTVYDCGYWLVCGSEPGMNFYDATKALYHLYQRTGLTADHTRFDDFCQAQWKWSELSGYKYPNPPRGHMLTGLIMCALDSHSDYFPGLYRMIYTYYQTDPTFLRPAGNGVADLRDGGVTLNSYAVAARADDDSTRHTNYCAVVSQIAQAWVDIYALEGSVGYFSEKDLDYPYTVQGFSPWRAAVGAVQALQRSYDVLVDTDTANGGCNDTTLAADILTVLQDVVPYLYTAGYNTTSRGVYYDIQHESNGLEGTDWLTGTVSVSASSTSVVGSGTSFLSSFACNGTDYIGISSYEGGFQGTIVGKVASCADNTHLTLAASLDGQCYYQYNGSTFDHICGTSALTGKIYRQAPATSTSCSPSSATYCYSADKNSARDLIWVMGWMYKTTGNSTYTTYGDELFAVSAGGPGDGAGGSDPCTGPNCTDTYTDWIASLHGCASNPTLPCNPNTNYGWGNVYVYGAKRYAQLNGQGGADNYLAWRAGAVPSTVGSAIKGNLTLRGGAIIQ